MDVFYQTSVYQSLDTRIKCRVLMVSYLYEIIADRPQFSVSLDPNELLHVIDITLNEQSDKELDLNFNNKDKN